MRITAIEPQARHPQRRNVFVDGEFALGMDAEAVLASDLFVGRELSTDELSQLRRAGEEQHAYERALRLLTYRPRSRAEIRRRLQAQQTSPETIARVLERLEAQGLLNDAEFARYWVENREQFHPRSGQALRQELRRHGVDADIVAEAISDENDAEQAILVGRKKVSSLRKADFATFRTKLGQFLQRRGFSYDVIREVVRTLWAETGQEKDMGADDEVS
jgi:regulatory protein